MYSHSDNYSYQEENARLRQALDDKDKMLREGDHRVSNNLTLVSSLLAMQSNATPSAEVKYALKIAAARITGIARIHERLSKTKRIGILEFDEYLEQICDDLATSLSSEGVQVQLSTVPLHLSVDHAVPLGLVITELITNAFKHSEGANVTITVALESSPGGFALTITDDGVGMPDDFVAGTGVGLGMKVVSLLTGQIGAEIELPEPGTAARFKIVIPASLAA